LPSWQSLLGNLARFPLTTKENIKKKTCLSEKRIREKEEAAFTEKYSAKKHTQDGKTTK